MICWEADVSVSWRNGGDSPFHSGRTRNEKNPSPPFPAVPVPQKFQKVVSVCQYLSVFVILKTCQSCDIVILPETNGIVLLRKCRSLFRGVSGENQKMPEMSGNVRFCRVDSGPET